MTPAPELLPALVAAACRAPSPDNMQAWAFRGRPGAVEVFLDRRRTLPTDVLDMFSWVGLGAAIENLVIAAARAGFAARVEHQVPGAGEGPAAVVVLTPGSSDDPLAGWIGVRSTHRDGYLAAPLDPALLTRLTGAAQEREAGVHWVTAATGIARLAALEARSSTIRLRERALREELFQVLRITREEVASTRHGLDLEALGIPRAGLLLARHLRPRALVQVAGWPGVSRLLSNAMAGRLRQAGGLCLITARRREPSGYIDAGRAMERLWLAATSQGLGVQPFGALPQYLTKVEVEPWTLLPRHAALLRRHREPFTAAFRVAPAGLPAIVLRVGRPLGSCASRPTARLPPEAVIRR